MSRIVPVTPTWQDWRQQQAELVPLDLDQMRAMVAEARERQERFAALFRRPDPPC